MIKITKKGHLYSIKVDAGNMTLLVDRIEKTTSKVYQLYDRGNWMGHIWAADEIQTVGFDLESL